MQSKWEEGMQQSADMFNKKYAFIIGTVVHDFAGTWKLARFNQSGVPYFVKQSKNGKWGKTEYTIGLDKAWADQALSEKVRTVP